MIVVISQRQKWVSGDYAAITYITDELLFGEASRMASKNQMYKFAILNVNLRTLII